MGKNLEDAALEAACGKLKERLRQLKKSGGIALAFSGGLDSLVLLQLCLKEELPVLALHFTGPHVAAESSSQAISWLQKHKVAYKSVAYPVLEVPEVRHNHPRRCYFCKKNAFIVLQKAAEGLQLCDGTNASDLNGYRPGLEALHELKVCSPLAESGLTKAQIRQLAEKFALDKPALAGQTCLLTRFDYGLEVSQEQLNTVNAAENELEAVLNGANSALSPIKNTAENTAQDKINTDPSQSNSAGEVLSAKAATNAAAESNYPPAQNSKPAPNECPTSNIYPILDINPAPDLPPAPVQFRLRYLKDPAAPSGMKPELHIQSESSLEHHLQAKLQQILSRHGLQNAAIVTMPRISGYFDRAKTR